MAATVSVSLPIRTAAWRESCRWRQGYERAPASVAGTGVVTTAATAACSAVTVYPLGVKRAPGTVSARLRARSSASLSHAVQRSRRTSGSRSRPGSEVDSLVQHGDADRFAPQHAGVAGERVGVGQLRDQACRPGQGLPVVEVGEGDRRGTHQRAVASSVTVGGCVAARLGPHDPRPPCLSAGDSTRRRTEDGGGLDTDVGRVGAVPVDETFRDGVQGGLVGEVGTRGGHLGDRGGHGGVVAPLPWREVTESSTFHLRERVGCRWLTELVGDAQGVARRGSEQHAGGAVGLGQGELHRCRLTRTHRVGVESLAGGPPAAADGPASLLSTASARRSSRSSWEPGPSRSSAQTRR